MIVNIIVIVHILYYHNSTDNDGGIGDRWGGKGDTAKKIDIQYSLNNDDQLLSHFDFITFALR